MAKKLTKRAQLLKDIKELMEDKGIDIIRRMAELNPEDREWMGERMQKWERTAEIEAIMRKEDW